MNNPEGLSDADLAVLRGLPPNNPPEAMRIPITDHPAHRLPRGMIDLYHAHEGTICVERTPAADQLIDLLDRKERETAAVIEAAKKLPLMFAAAEHDPALDGDPDAYRAFVCTEAAMIADEIHAAAALPGEGECVRLEGVLRHASFNPSDRSTVAIEIAESALASEQIAPLIEKSVALTIARRVREV